MQRANIPICHKWFVLVRSDCDAITVRFILSLCSKRRIAYQRSVPKVKGHDICQRTLAFRDVSLRHVGKIRPK